MIVPSLLRNPNEWNSQLPSLPVQVRTLNTRAPGRRAPSAIRDAAARTRCSRARIAGALRAGCRDGTKADWARLQLQRRQQVLDLHHVVYAFGDDALDCAAKLGEIARPRERAERARAPPA